MVGSPAHGMLQSEMLARKTNRSETDGRTLLSLPDCSLKKLLEPLHFQFGGLAGAGFGLAGAGFGLAGAGFGLAGADLLLESLLGESQRALVPLDILSTTSSQG
jgi:hypothetical protein